MQIQGLVELAWSKRQVCLQRAVSLARGKGRSEQGMSSDFLHLVHVSPALPELCMLHSQPAQDKSSSLSKSCYIFHLHIKRNNGRHKRSM